MVADAQQQPALVVYNPVGWHHLGKLHLASVSREWGRARLTYCGQRWTEQGWQPVDAVAIAGLPAGTMRCQSCERSARGRGESVPWADTVQARAIGTAAVPELELEDRA